MSEFPNQLLERYEYLSQLGSGATGIVYLARDRVLEKDVAIKMLSGAASTRSRLVRFQKEARAAARLNHDNIIKVFDFGVMKDGAPYMVMEYLGGTSLKDFLKGERADDPALMLDLLAQIASGMSHAHSQGIIHRDLKADNVMIVPGSAEGEWRAQIIDFGIAHLTSLDLPDGFESSANAIVGSPCYISPESIKSEGVDARTDIYSLGCILFEVFCGDVPFRGEDAVSTMEMHMKQPPPPVVLDSRFELSKNDGFIDKLEGVVKKCIAKDPGRRYPSMKFLEEDLRELRQSLQELFLIDQAVEPDEGPAVPSGLNRNMKLNPTAGGSLTRGRLKIPFLLIVLVSFLALPMVGWAYYKNAIVTEQLNRDIRKNHVLPNGGLVSLTPAGLEIGDLNYSTVTDEDIIAGKYKRTGEKYLNFKFSNIGDRGVEALDLIGVEKINLDDTGITDESMVILSKVPTLREVYADETAITDRGLAAIVRLPYLSALKVENVSITDDGIKKLLAAEHLSTLDFGLCKGITLNCIPYLKRMKGLASLRISKTAIKPRHLKGFARLKRLSYEFGELSEGDLEAILTMKELERLTLTGCKLKSADFLALAKLPKLKMLMLSGCRQITEEQVDRFNGVRDEVFVQTLLPYKKTCPRDYSYKKMLKGLKGQRRY